MVDGVVNPAMGKSWIRRSSLSDCSLSEGAGRELGRAYWPVEPDHQERPGGGADRAPVARTRRDADGRVYAQRGVDEDGVDRDRSGSFRAPEGS